MAKQKGSAVVEPTPAKRPVVVKDEPKAAKPAVVKEAPKAAWTYEPLKAGKGAVDGQRADGSFWAASQPGRSFVHAAADNQRALCGRSLQNQKTLERLQTNWRWVKTAVTCKRCLAKQTT